MPMAGSLSASPVSTARAWSSRAGHGAVPGPGHRWTTRRGAAARAGYTDAEVEYGIALFNGTGTAKNERAAGEFLTKAARKNNAPAQSRLALMYATGKGIKADPAQAAAPEIPVWLRLHRLVAVPFRQLRRRLLVARGVRTGRGSAATEAFAEDAVRRESARAA